MNYTINEAAQKFGLSAHTLRYYDKEGLLPFVSRSHSGNRTFTDSDLEWIALICCLKNTGMPIKEIKQYVDWCRQGSATIDVRKALFVAHRQAVLRQIEELNNNLELIDAKIAFYESPGIASFLDEQIAKQSDSLQRKDSLYDSQI
ncbi:MerR family transcriptional regulator [Paenibacillus protaetiae]|uniref:MerR family transcriptional regulator n=1 Tax=Paenibacillus protaetiae TaxID=2509456 RepID=A0A4P6F7V1_9BACL|nr:MerR family transcriptional regulator [Paenibacillus protaetiae]QAY66508.1 MerR family transcriptional regulator [Paenibacillus protaetiae]